MRDAYIEKGKVWLQSASLQEVEQLQYFGWNPVVLCPSVCQLLMVLC
jgi:hypothetical protein